MSGNLLAKVSDMPTVIPQPEEMQSMCLDGDMKGAEGESTPPDKKADTSVQTEKDIQKGKEVVDMPQKQKSETTDDDKENHNLITQETAVADPEKLRKPKHRRHRCICVIFGFIVSLGLAITAIVLTLISWHQPHVKQTSGIFHHAFFHLKTDGYEKLDDVINLQWLKDNSQNVGNINLVDGCYFSVPQNGLYQINFAIQLHIPKGTPASVVTLMLQRKNNEKDYVFMKKSSSSLNIAEHDMIQSSFRYKLKTGDKVFLRMNMAKFISRNKNSSYLYITRLNTNNNH